MAAKRGSFRIIGGQWRGRRLEFVDDGSVRPSADRLRETLFNWAAPVVRGAHCLDLFAGSGALGLEALSRGASDVVFVDKQRSVIQGIEQHLKTLGAQAETRCSDARSYLGGSNRLFDLVFVDPPFRQAWLPDLLLSLQSHLRAGSHVYVEAEKELAIAWPDTYELLKSKTAGQVGYHWLRYSGQASSNNSVQD